MQLLRALCMICMMGGMICMMGASALSVGGERYVLDLQRCSNASQAWQIGRFHQAGLGNCSHGPPFNMSAISSLQSDLSSAWPACQTEPGQSAVAWRGAWERDGRRHHTCMHP